MVIYRRRSGRRARGYSAPRRYKGHARNRRKLQRFIKGRSRTGGYYGRYRTSPHTGEKKFHDLLVDDNDIAVNGTIIDASVLTIAQDTTESTRIGRKILITNIGWKWTIFLNGAVTAAAASETVRIVLYLDKQCNGAAATIADIFEIDDLQTFRNIANSKRFVILMDRTYVISAPGGSGRGTTDSLAWGGQRLTDSFFKKCSIPIEYDSTVGAITEMRSNNIGVAIFGENGSRCILTSHMRIRFTG